MEGSHLGIDVKPRAQNHSVNIYGAHQSLSMGATCPADGHLLGGGGGGHWGTEWLPSAMQTAMPSGGDECQNLGAVNAFEGKKEEQATSNCEPNTL